MVAGNPEEAVPGGTVEFKESVGRPLETVAKAVVELGGLLGTSTPVPTAEVKFAVAVGMPTEADPLVTLVDGVGIAEDPVPKGTDTDPVFTGSSVELMVVGVITPVPEPNTAVELELPDVNEPVPKETEGAVPVGPTRLVWLVVLVRVKSPSVRSPPELVNEKSSVDTEAFELELGAELGQA